MKIFELSVGFKDFDTPKIMFVKTSSYCATTNCDEDRSIELLTEACNREHEAVCIIMTKKELGRCFHYDNSRVYTVKVQSNTNTEMETKGI